MSLYTIPCGEDCECEGQPCCWGYVPSHEAGTTVQIDLSGFTVIPGCQPLPDSFGRAWEVTSISLDGVYNIPITWDTGTHTFSGNAVIGSYQVTYYVDSFSCGGTVSEVLPGGISITVTCTGDAVSISLFAGGVLSDVWQVWNGSVACPETTCPIAWLPTPPFSPRPQYFTSGSAEIGG